MGSSAESKQRTEILRQVVAQAESMGLRDKKQIEQLTSRVIERMEQRQTLPGMEDFVPKLNRQRKSPPSKAEIQAIVNDILANEPPSPRTEMKEIKPEEDKPMIDRVHSNTGNNISGLTLTQNARQVLEKRYLKKDKQGKVVETAEELFRRVADAIAAAETIYDPKAETARWSDEFYRAMINLEFLPNSPTLMNAGRELGQLSACFVLPIEDSMESIFDAVKYTALIHKSGGGTGFSFSRLRPHQDRVGSTGGVASGPVSFMRAFDTATDVIKQGGMRRGANMAILSVDHPDIMKFITAKTESTALNNFNLSVAITGEFMQAVKDGTEYNLINPHNNEVHSRLSAREVFDKIVDMAWRTGDPGIIFIDRINQDNPTPQLGKIESTNPCGEQPLLPYESCNLGSINLSRMLTRENGKVEVDFDKLARTTRLAARFLDNVIDINKFPLPQIENMTKTTRKIGLGVMGFADMLIELGIPYDSEEALNLARHIMTEISHLATEESRGLAKERGVFPSWEGSIYGGTGCDRLRNATRTTIAPTGTLSIIAGCSSGIEPLFALSYTRNILDGARLIEVHPYFEAVAKSEGFYSEDLMSRLASGTSLHEIENIPDDVKSIFVTAHDISPEWHVRMQAAFQRETNNAVSKTVNFPHEATREDVKKVYTLAFELGLKGITIYRDRSRDTQVLMTGKSETSKAENAETVPPPKLTPRDRPKKTSGVTEKVTTGCGSIYVTVNSDEQGICEVFSSLGKAGGCASAQLEATCRLVSLALRSGVETDSILKQLRGIRCPSIAWEEGKAVLSCADAIATVLERQVDGITSVPVGGAVINSVSSGPVKNVAGQCPDCGSLLAYEEGCFKCRACGFTRC